MKITKRQLRKMISEQLDSNTSKTFSETFQEALTKFYKLTGIYLKTSPSSLSILNRNNSLSLEKRRTGEKIEFNIPLDSISSLLFEKLTISVIPYVYETGRGFTFGADWKHHGMGTNGLSLLTIYADNEQGWLYTNYNCGTKQGYKAGLVKI